MEKTISGSIFILTSAILFIGHYLVAAIIANGQTSASSGLINIPQNENFPNSILTFSTITLVIGSILIMWGLIEYALRGRVTR